MKQGLIAQNQQVESEAATPEQQARYDLIVKDAIAQLYGENKFEPLVETLTEAAKLDLPEIMADIINSVIGAMEQKHGSIEELILIGLGEELVVQLKDILMAAGIKELSEDEVTDTLTKAIYKYMNNNKDKVEDIDQAELQQLADESGVSEEMQKLQSTQQPQEEAANG